MKPWRMLKEAMLPGVDLRAGVAMVVVVVCGGGLPAERGGG